MERRPKPAPVGDNLLPPIDHLVWGGLHLEQEIERLEDLTGVRAMLGGRHPGEGTRNALIRLGPNSYLELIAPDPEQPRPPGARWFGLDSLTAPRLVAWAARSADLDQQAAKARTAGVPVGEARGGRRELSNGRVLAWRLTYPLVPEGVQLVPFLIDWGDGPHPAETAPPGAHLIDLRAEHPDPASILDQLRRLGVDLRILSGPAPALIATLDTPRGRVELR
jgi:hypothetical protein